MGGSSVSSALIVSRYFSIENEDIQQVKDFINEIPKVKSYLFPFEI